MPYLTYQHIREVRRLLAEPTAWAQGELGLDAWGKGVDPAAEDATSWCLRGAYERVSGARDETTIHRVSCTFMDQLREYPHNLSCVEAHINMVSWNDCPYTTHQEVLGVLDSLIRLFEIRNMTR